MMMRLLFLAGCCRLNLLLGEFGITPKVETSPNEAHHKLKRAS